MNRLCFILAAALLPIGVAADAPPSSTPPITANELREDILRLMESLREENDFRVANVQHQTGEILSDDVFESDGVTMSSTVTSRVQQGWIYSYTLTKPKRTDLSMTLGIDLFPARQATRDRKATCTLAFRPFAGRMERLGYTRYPPASKEPGRTRNTLRTPFINVFRRTVGETPLVAVAVYHYPPESEHTTTETCIARVDASLQPE
jgi:hypothetical protein